MSAIFTQNSRQKSAKGNSWCTAVCQNKY